LTYSFPLHNNTIRQLGEYRCRDGTAPGRHRRSAVTKLQPFSAAARRVDDSDMSSARSTLGRMPVEETMWDVRVTRDIETYDLERLRAAFADIIAKQLAPGKRLLRVVTWCQDGGSLFRTRSSQMKSRTGQAMRRYAVAYEVVYTA
jgi:hypothetical protein